MSRTRSCTIACSDFRRTIREIIDLAYYQRKGIEAVAEMVGISANTVKTRMFMRAGIWRRLRKRWA